MVYVDYVQVLANNPTWTEQVEQEKIEESALSYVTLKERKTNSVNQTNATELMLDLHRTVINNMYFPQGFETLAIPYSINQLANSQLWDSNFCLVSIFEVNEYLKDDAKNIVCSLYRMAVFVRQ